MALSIIIGFSMLLIGGIQALVPRVNKDEFIPELGGHHDCWSCHSFPSPLFPMTR